MSVFDGILGAGVSALGSFFGQRDVNRENVDLARENRGWQEELSNTAHQREVRDLIAAGLNPILAVSRGGAATPSGNVAVVQSPTSHAVSSGWDAYRSAQEVSKSRTEQRRTQQVIDTMRPVERGAGYVEKGLDAVEAGVRGAVDSVLDRVLPLTSQVPAAAVKLAEGVSGHVASAVEQVKDVAHKFGVSVDEVIDAPSKFVSAATTSAADFVDRTKRYVEDAKERSLRYVPRNKVVAGSFSGDRRKDLADIAAIKDPHERRMAKQSYRLFLEKTWR